MSESPKVGDIVATMRRPFRRGRVSVVSDENVTIEWFDCKPRQRKVSCLSIYGNGFAWKLEK